MDANQIIFVATPATESERDIQSAHDKHFAEVEAKITALTAELALLTEKVNLLADRLAVLQDKLTTLDNDGK